jgi:hypothetical protein
MKSIFSKAWLVAVFSIVLSTPVSGQEIYVSPTGNDNASGTREKPVASFARAQEMVRKSVASTAKVIFLKGT